MNNLIAQYVVFGYAGILKEGEQNNEQNNNVTRE